MIRALAGNLVALLLCVAMMKVALLFVSWDNLFHSSSKVAGLREVAVRTTWMASVLLGEVIIRRGFKCRGWLASAPFSILALIVFSFFMNINITAFYLLAGFMVIVAYNTVGKLS